MNKKNILHKYNKSDHWVCLLGGGACVFSCHDLSVFSEKGGGRFEEGRRGQI